jgi:hydroxymethylpyrimidine pyrophosphatase-like HAD family hydrolase
MALYRDIYGEGMWYLEIYSVNASKYNAAEFLREQGGYDRLVGFGDNRNDIPLLKACDEFYAVENAVDELKQLAAGIISSNVQDGVARFLLLREKESSVL